MQVTSSDKTGFMQVPSGIISALQVICSDKTGTLTTNQMAVAKVAVPEAPFQLREFEVSGGLIAHWAA